MRGASQARRRRSFTRTLRRCLAMSRPQPPAAAAASADGRRARTRCPASWQPIRTTPTSCKLHSSSGLLSLLRRLRRRLLRTDTLQGMGQRRLQLINTSSSLLREGTTRGSFSPRRSCSCGTEVRSQCQLRRQPKMCTSTVRRRTRLGLNRTTCPRLVAAEAASGSSSHWLLRRSMVGA